MCGTNAAGFCLRSAVLSSLWAPGQAVPAFVQAFAGSRNPEGIFTPGMFLWLQGKLWVWEDVHLCFAELEASCGASWCQKQWQKEPCVTLVRGECQDRLTLTAAPELIHGEK